MHDRSEKPIVLTLDAGGTNFDFLALRGDKGVGGPIRLPSNGDDLQQCIRNMEDGFSQLMEALDEKPIAISFAFPGPADYEQGIIGDLNNLPAFRGGVPLKAILENKFQIPVFINNDANLFALGESIAGFLPEVNSLLKEAANPKQYKNILGVTLGTGFGGGFVMNGQMLKGDNSLGCEIWVSSSQTEPGVNAEEAISIRAVRQAYAEQSGIGMADSPSPKEIGQIARGELEGNRDAGIYAFRKMGAFLGDVLANLISFTDGLVVIGGGVSYEHPLIFPAMMEQLNKPFNINGKTIERLVQKVYNLEEEAQKNKFLKPDYISLEWDGLGTMQYMPKPNIAIGRSKLGTRNATSIGAYATALAELGYDQWY